MDLKKMMLVFVALIFVATTAFAGNIPEFDAVGCDASNYFNDAIKDSVTTNNIDGNGKRINCFSDFPMIELEGCDGNFYDYGEQFTANMGMLFPDPCFPGYYSVLTPYSNTGTYEWWIVLQMKPESDIDLNIVDCVLKDNYNNIWDNAQQTGRFRTSQQVLKFIKVANPSVTVEAIPGPFHVRSFCGPFIMDARKTPTLGKCPMKEKLYTSKALWEESIVLVLPKSGVKNKLGFWTYDLHQGDLIKVTIDIPKRNTCYVRYGEDNVVLKYIGMVFTEYTTDDPCCTAGPCDPPVIP